MIRYSISENTTLLNRPEAGLHLKINERKKYTDALLISSFVYFQGAFVRELLLEEFAKVWTIV